MNEDYSIAFKRIYEDSADDDGSRILADRIWPRGVSKEDADLTDWCKEVCPSDELRKSYHADELSYPDFAKCYLQELEDKYDALTPLLGYARKGKVTLLSAVKSLDKSHLPVLRKAMLHALHLEDEQADGSELNSPVCFADEIQISDEK